MTNLLDAALAYARKGWPVFPCRADKKPMTENGVLDATTNPQTVAEWWSKWPRANIGCDVAGAGFMVLDLDPGHDWAELEANCGKIPETALVQRTPRGGEHLFFELREGEIVSPSASKLAKAVDVRSFNSYVLLAPSATKDGDYSWASEGRAAYRTDDMVRVANSHREKSRDRDKWIIEPDLDENIAAAIKWLKNDAKIAIEGRGGDAMAYATAAHMKSFGISEALAFDLMWEHWNPRCEPPWSVDEVEHLETKVKNGYSYNTSPPGNITAAYRVAQQTQLFAPVKAETPTGQEFTAGRFRIVDRAGMDHIRPPEWLIEGVMPQGSHTILFGKPGSFKSFIAIDMALSVASGCNFPWPGLWGDVVESGPVLYCAGEGRSQMSKRVTAWERTYWGGGKVDNFTLLDPVPTILEPLDDFLSAASAIHRKYKLVVIDTTGRSMAGANENSQEHASIYSQMVMEIQRTLDTAVLSIMHEGHTEANRERGSSVFGADADVRLRLERREKDYAVTMAMLKQKDAEEWAYRKRIELAEVKLDDEIKTLVARKPKEPEKQIITTPEKTKGKAVDKAEVFALKKIDDVLKGILEQNRLRAWSQKDLAGAIAVHPDIDVPGSVLHAEYLTTLREQKGTAANKCYDPSLKRFKAAAQKQTAALDQKAPGAGRSKPM